MLLPDLAPALQLSLTSSFEKEKIRHLVKAACDDRQSEKVASMMVDLYTQLQIQKNVAAMLVKFCLNYDGQGEENRYTPEELQYIVDGLNQMIADGFAESDDSPVVSALMKTLARQGNVMIQYQPAVSEDDPF